MNPGSEPTRPDDENLATSVAPQRLRTVPHQFSWIDQRLVCEGHIARCGGAQAL
jgi:hypothetical protein